MPPHEIVRQALFFSSEARILISKLGEILAGIVREETQALQKNRKTVELVRRRFLLGILILASEIPSHPELFQALRGLQANIKGQGPAAVSLEALRLPLLQALTYQQTDPSMEPEWLDLLHGWPDGENLEDPPTLLLLAWRGLLWIPPESDGKSEAEILDFNRIEKGLLALAKTMQGQEEAEDLLREALEILRDTFPRSGEFWEERLRPRIGEWPEQLRDLSFEVWPGLRSFQVHFPSGALFWETLARPGRECVLQRKLTSPVGEIFSSRAKEFWHPLRHNPADICSHLNLWLHSDDAFRLLHTEPSPSHSSELSEGADVQFFLASRALPRLGPEPDIIQLGAGSAMYCQAKTPHAQPPSWQALDTPLFIFSAASGAPEYFCSYAEDFGKTADLWRQQSAEQALFALSFYKALTRKAVKQVKDQILELHRPLVPMSAPPSVAEAASAYWSRIEQSVMQKVRIDRLPGLAIAAVLNLAFVGPTPADYLSALRRLQGRARKTALSQIFRAERYSWNPLERLYFLSISTLVALQDEDFRRALQMLESLASPPPLLEVEHKILEIHAKAGAGERRSSVQMFRDLEQRELPPPAQSALELLDEAYGLSGRQTAPDQEQYQELILLEANMVEAATSGTLAA
jgi:hypothetical protein